MREIIKRDTGRSDWSSVDIFMVLYGACTVLSYCLSDYRQTALFGYVDRYMGLVTQLLLVSCYFLLSRFCVGRKLLKWMQDNLDYAEFGKQRIKRGIASVLVMTGLVIVLYQIAEPVRQLFDSWLIVNINKVLTRDAGISQETAIRYFMSGTWRQKLLGVGPDCFGCIINNELDYLGQIAESAQNEWLHLLVTGGLMGIFSYLGILIGALQELWRRRKKHPVLVMGIPVIAGYLLIGMLRVQQMITTAILFVTLGLAMGLCREKKVAGETEREVSVDSLEVAFSVLQGNGSEEQEGRRLYDEYGIKNDGGRGRRMQRLAVFTAVMVTGAMLCLGYSTFLLANLFGAEARSEVKMAALREQSTATEITVNSKEEMVSEPNGASAETDLEVLDEVGDKVSTEVDEPDTDISKPEVEPEEYVSEYASLFEQNEDMAAWIKIDGTNIDYPVMQTPEEENYYLYRDFYGEADKAGCLILDGESPLYGQGTTNQIIHGHNMKSGTMFGELDKYREEAYGKEHNRIQLFTREDEREYEVIAVFYSRVYLTTDLTFKYYNFVQADTEEEFYYFYENIKALSIYDTGVEAEPGDRFLTLSTCAYHTEDGRFVVVAREIKDE